MGLLRQRDLARIDLAGSSHADFKCPMRPETSADVILAKTRALRMKNTVTAKEPR
jgi:hypothetical protein